MPVKKIYHETQKNTAKAKLHEIIGEKLQKRWGFWLCFEHMRSVLHMKYNHKACIAFVAKNG
jgi:hypothetical protein